MIKKGLLVRLSGSVRFVVTLVFTVAWLSKKCYFPGFSLKLICVPLNLFILPKNVKKMENTIFKSGILRNVHIVIYFLTHSNGAYLKRVTSYTIEYVYTNNNSFKNRADIENSLILVIPVV